MDMAARLEALSSGPKPWLVTCVWSDGPRTLRQPFEASARNYAERECRKIGKTLLRRGTNEEVKLLSVSVEYVPE